GAFSRGHLKRLQSTLRDCKPQRNRVLGRHLARSGCSQKKLASLVGFAKLMATFRGIGSPARRKLVDAFTVMWGSAELDELLLEHTAPGWPRRYARLPRPASPS
ncbi:MAG: hypothetical protein ACHQ06_07840, partial [Candidatus Dormibacteria bacterium]